MNQQSQTNNSVRDIFSVSRLVRETRAVLEASFPLLWVSGEISNLAQPASGHIYFSLKDESAQVRCAMFRMKRQRLRFQPGNGQQVLIRAKVSLYEARGEFQLIAEHMEPAGEGALRVAFEQLKQKLAAEGLFDGERKKQLPVPPKQLGLITSPTGAAVRDLLSVLKRRFPALPVIIYPVQVQGEDATRQIVQMLKLAEQRQECDLLILSRGGGSIEDLQAFNEEQVARAIDRCTIPVVTGIGHEIDFTIADFVADRRAPTPSAAAELVTPDQLEWQQRLRTMTKRLQQFQQQRLQQLEQQCTALIKRLHLQHPKQRLQQQAQRLDDVSDRLSRQFHFSLLQRNQRLERLHTRLARQTPEQRLKRFIQLITNLEQRLYRAVKQRLEQDRNRFTQLGRDLHNLSPLNTLGRGYAIVCKSADGAVITDSADVEPGEQIETRLHKGKLVCQVISKQS
ncbi:MAG: exodeoxyribonuclease VII large subunit [Candidatus Thiodiazotropha sp.]